MHLSCQFFIQLCSLFTKEIAVRSQSCVGFTLIVVHVRIDIYLAAWPMGALHRNYTLLVSHLCLHIENNRCSQLMVNKSKQHFASLFFPLRKSGLSQLFSLVQSWPGRRRRRKRRRRGRGSGRRRRRRRSSSRFGTSEGKIL